MSLLVGLTGGLASGKTQVAQMFASRGAYVLYADKVGYELMQPGQAVYDEIVSHFGPAILNPDKTIARTSLAEAAFGSGRIEELNRIVHPAVSARLEQWIAEMRQFDPKGVFMFEAALILEAGMGKHFDKLIVVTSSFEQKLERFADRVLGPAPHENKQHAQARKEAERRISAQLSESEKTSAADYLVDNSGTLGETERQVNKIFKDLKTLASGRQSASGQYL
jgi:dephospho-CoA kinase